jgi:hypothetical protein
MVHTSIAPRRRTICFSIFIPLGPVCDFVNQLARETLLLRVAESSEQLDRKKSYLIPLFLTIDTLIRATEIDSARL